jgi:hypothetical protein
VSQNAGAFTNISLNPGSVPAFDANYPVSNYTVTLNVASISSNAPSITVTLQKPNGTTTASTANLGNNVCTYGTVSTIVSETFRDEAQRLVLNSDTAWTSSATLVDGNAQVRNGDVQWPNATECPGFVAATQEYQRNFAKNLAYDAASTGTLTFGGLTDVATQITAYGTGDLNVLLQLDDDAMFFDLGRAVGSNNGSGDGTTRADSKGARSSSTGGALAWSIGTYSTADNNNVFRLIVIFRNATRTITSIVSS